jgi:hypothetical protein
MDGYISRWETTLLMGTCPDSERNLNKNSGNPRSDLGSSKLNKISRDGIKI